MPRNVAGKYRRSRRPFSRHGNNIDKTAICDAADPTKFRRIFPSDILTSRGIYGKIMPSQGRTVRLCRADIPP